MKSNCQICGTEIEITMCCSGRECGCMGQPTEPPVCSERCLDIYALSNNPSMVLGHTFIIENKEWEIKTISEGCFGVECKGPGQAFTTITYKEFLNYKYPKLHISVDIGKGKDYFSTAEIRMGKDGKIISVNAITTGRFKSPGPNKANTPKP